MIINNLDIIFHYFFNKFLLNRFGSLDIVSIFTLPISNNSEKPKSLIYLDFYAIFPLIGRVLK